MQFCGHFSRVVVSDFRSLRGDIVFRPLLARQSPVAKIPFQARFGGVRLGRDAWDLRRDPFRSGREREMKGRALRGVCRRPYSPTVHRDLRAYAELLKREGGWRDLWRLIERFDGREGEFKMKMDSFQREANSQGAAADQPSAETRPRAATTTGHA